MDVSAFYTLIGDLTNDPAHDRYTTSQILTVMNNVLDEWNLEAAVLKDTVTLTTVAGTRSYLLSTLTGTPVRFDRVTHLGIELERRDKSWFDLYASDDWSDDTGTPKMYYINVSDPDLQNIYLYPTPQDADAGANLVVEYVKRQDTLTATTDIPFNSNTLLYPYHHGIAYRASALLLLRDPTPDARFKASGYQSTASAVLTKVIEVFKEQEKEEPPRLRGGRYFGHY